MNARKLGWSLWFSFAAVILLFSNTQPMLASSSATTTSLAVTSGAGAVTTVNTGSVITLTATVVTSGGTAVKTGRVNFCDAGHAYCTDIHLLGTAQLTSAGTAVLKLVPGVGNHSYQAVFLGTASTTTSASGDSLLTVTGSYKTTTLIAQSGSVDNYTLNAVVAGQGVAAPTGQVSFLDDSNNNAPLGSGTLVANPADYVFLNVQSPATGNQPNSVATGDFNGDGIPDLAVANRFDNTVTILLGNGDGTFRTTAISPATGDAPVAVVSGDFNGDGKADLAVANNADGTVSILLGNGDGTFTLKATPTTGNNPAALVVGDFNGDGKADLAVANNSSNSVSILLGRGDGAFTALTSTIPTGNSPTAIAAGDFDGDGKTDLVVANGADGTLTVLLGRGNGSFKVVSSTLTTGRSPQSIVVADFNQDGSPDIAVANSIDNNLSVYLNLADGSGGFNAPVTYTTGNAPNSVMAGDFDGDGNSDLAVANSGDNTLTVFLGDGQGGFTATATTPMTGGYPWSIAVSDFNGDGYADIASANFLDNTATVLLAEQQTAAASAGPIAVAGPGPHMAVASYLGDSAYSGSVSSSTPLYASTPAPIISPASGVYTTGQPVSITDGFNGAAIYYTTDGSTPTSASTLYTVPFSVSTSETVQAIAVGSGFAPSAVTTSVLTFNLPPAPAPVIQLASGTYAPGQIVSISDSMLGSTIYYTTNGSIPSTNSLVYAGSISLSSSETLVASAIAPGYSMSAPVSAQYIVTGSSTSFIYSIAGNGNAGYQGDGGLATLAGLNSPSGSVFDSAGNLYIADTYNNLVRKITAGTGIITTIAGTGTAGYSGDGSAAVNAQLNWPTALALDSVGNLYIADSNNFSVRRVDKNGTITTYAGSSGVLGNSGNGGPAASAQLSYVDGIAFDSANNLYIADSGNSQIWEVLGATSTIAVVAGNGAPGYSGDSGPAIDATLNSPNGVAVDHAGNVYIADKNNNAIREIAAGTNVISTVAGDGSGAAGYVGDGGLATSAEFDAPMAVTVDAAGDLFIADSRNSVIRRVDTNTQYISTVAGNGSFCSPLSGDGSPALSAGLCYPTGITVDAAGNLYIADSLDQRIREVTVASAPLTAAAAAPAFSVASGTYPGGQTVNLSDSTPGASIYITMDGTTPTALSPGYLGPINVSGSVTVQAIAVAPGYLPSAPATAAYTINYPPSTVISTVAGDGVNGFNGAGGSATTAEFGYLQGLALDGVGNLYMADIGNNVIWMYSPTTGNISIVAGNGSAGYSGDGALATGAQLNYPSGPAVDPSGDLYIADSSNNVIRVVTAGSQMISTFAGSTQGAAGYSGDGGAATSAELSNPTGVAVDSAGNVYIADSGNSVVRMVTLSTGVISTFAGDGLYVDNGDGGPAGSAGVQQPVALAFDNSGNLFIAEENGRIRRVDAITNVITTVAGNGDQGYSGDGALATNAEISEPTIAFDQAGNLYISNLPAAVREVSATTGMITTAAGSGITGFSGDGGSATVAELDEPTGVVVDASGNLYIADASNFRVRKVTFPVPAATPVFSLTPGSYINTRQVTITDGTTGAAIYYTTDGTTPTEGSTLYSGQIAVTASETLQAIAVAKGYAASAVASAAYTIIPPSTPVITWPAPSPVSYGTILDSTQLDATTTVPGAWVYTPAAGTTPTAGSQTLSVTFTPDDLVDYTTATASVTLTVNQATAVIAVTPYSVTYDGAAHSASGTATGVGGANLTADLILSGTTHTAAGAYASDAWSFVDPSGNYVSASGTVSDAITQATANITVTGYSVVYDGAAHTATGVATGAGGTNLSADLTLSGTTHTAAGTYPADSWSFVDPSGNYANASGAVADMIQAAVPILPTPGTGTGTYGSSETLSVTITATSGEVPRGTVQFQFVNNSVTYNICADGTLEAQPVATPCAVTLDGTGTASVTTTSLPANVAADTVTATYIPGDNNYTGGTTTINYTVTQASTQATLAITPATTPTYGDTVTLSSVVSDNTPGSTGTPTGTVQFAYSVDGANWTNLGSTVTLTTNPDGMVSAQTTTAALPAGSPNIKAIYSGDSNFAGTISGTTVYAVNQKTLTVSGITANSKPYDGNTSATLNSSSAVLVGAVGTDDVTLGGSATGVFADPNAGSGKQVTISGLTLSGATATNYTLTQPTATASISKVLLTVTSPSLVVAYGDPVPALTPMITGFVNGEGATVLTAQPVCTTTYTSTSNAGSAQTTSCTGATAANYTFNYVGGTVTVNKATPSVTVMPSSPSITTTQSLQVTVNVSGAAGTTTPTGTITLSSGSYNAQQILAGGSTTFTVAAGVLAVGSDSLSASYVPDAASTGTYNAAMQTVTESVLQAIGTSIATVTATPSATPITDMRTETVTISVAGGSGQPVPTGTITLTSGAYSAQQALVSGAAKFTIPAGALASGANTLTATYSGDATFAIATGSTSVTVSPFVISVPAISAVTPGADGTATITVTAGSTYSGTIDLTCALTGSPAGATSLPACSFNPTTLTLTPGGTGTSVLTVTTTAATTALARPAGNGLWGLGSGVALAAMVMFGIPSRRRRWISMIVLLLVVAAAGTIGCGGHASSGGGSTTTPGTTAGTYTFTITGTDSVTKTVTTSTTISITVQ